MTHRVYAIVDHLVNNAGVAQIDMFEDCKQISDFATIMVCFFTATVDISWFLTCAVTQLQLKYKVI
jgi:NADP-dependent 3-hydroxy acid dehydrogenase YdfG